MPVKTWNAAASAGEYGTVGCIVRYNGRLALLTAGHVLCPVWEGLSPGAHRDIRIEPDGSTVGATLSHWRMPVTRHGYPAGDTTDVALAVLDDKTADIVLRSIELPSGVRTLRRNGEKVYFHGATTGRLYQTVVHDIAAEVPMRYRVYAQYGSPSFRTVEAQLSGMIQTDANMPVQGGDSGCLLFDRDGNALGLLVGTDPTDTYPYFTHLEPLLSFFNVELVTAHPTSVTRRLRTLVSEVFPHA